MTVPERPSPHHLGPETLHQRFSWLAHRYPGHPALVSGGRTVSYSQLDARSSAWAAGLAQFGVGSGNVVPVSLTRSVDLVTAVLAVLKTGAAYTLLDPEWPAARVRQACDLVGGSVMITPEIARRLGDATAASFAAAESDPASPACVFFTSGTTGVPKAVLSPHVATLRLFGPRTFMRTGQGLVIAVAAALPWDAFALELWSALATGGTAALASERYLSAGELREMIARVGVNAAWLTSSLFNMIVAEDLDAFSGLEELLIGGERLSVPHVRQFLTRHPGIRLVNGYGPVESTVFATTHDITLADTERPTGIPLGRSVPETDVRILQGDEVAPRGARGEILVGGRGLAIGYLGDSAATESKFVTLRLDGDRGRYYRTGDQGHLDDDGVLHFAGRMDRQVKIRGLRVEPAEVEAVLAEHLPVVACRVLAANDPTTGDRRLVAFCVARQQLDFDAVVRLRSVLLPQQVPELVWLDRIPLTSNGKTDEAALLAGLADSLPRDARTAPTDSAPDRIRVAFHSVLGKHIGDDASFFASGGSSLDAGRVSARLTQAMGYPVPVSRIYQAPTVNQLSTLLGEVADAEPSGGLSSMQRIFLMKSVIDPGDVTNHCLMAWRVHGPLDRLALDRALGYLQRHQPVLRSAFGLDFGIRVNEDVPLPLLREIACDDFDDAQCAVIRELSAPFDPSDGLIWRASLARWTKQDAFLGLAFHHVAFDGSSEAIVANELSLGYQRRELPVRGLVPRIRAWSGSALGAAVGAALRGVPPLRWPEEQTGSGGVSQCGSFVTRAAMQAAAERAARSGTTLFAVLLHAWGQTLAGVSDARDLAVGVPLTLRDGDGGEDVGCHMTTVAVRLTGEALLGGDRGLAAVAEQWRQAVVQRDAPLAEVLKSASHGNRPPVFQTMLALQDQADLRLDLPGVSTSFVRLPYLDLSLELLLELWPQPSGGLAAIASYRRDVVGDATAKRCLVDFVGQLGVVADGGAP